MSGRRPYRFSVIFSICVYLAKYRLAFLILWLLFAVCALEPSCSFWLAGLWGAHPILDRDSTDLTCLGSVSLCCLVFSCGLSSFGFPFPGSHEDAGCAGFRPVAHPHHSGGPQAAGIFPGGGSRGYPREP